MRTGRLFLITCLTTSRPLGSTTLQEQLPGQVSELTLRNGRITTLKLFIRPCLLHALAILIRTQGLIQIPGLKLKQAIAAEASRVATLPRH